MTLEEDLAKLLDKHFPDARIKKEPELIDQSGMIKVNSEDWKKAKQVVK